ncbi:MAG: ribosome silencing factor [Thermodesulfovibrionales bacterium]|nr:ribosome silencing factor [Thermodesulfovibrionales bacterium]
MAKASLDKKATDILILELKDLTFITDYYVICSASNVIQVKTIAENIENTLLQKGIRPYGIEGLSFAHWVLMDYGDVIVHIFEEHTRSYYNLEKFWLDAPRISLSIEHENKSIMDRKDQREVHQ